MIELTQIQTGQLLDLFQSIDQCISVYKQLTGGLGYVQIIFKEFLDGEQGLLIQALDAALLEHSRRNISQTVVGSW